MRNFFGFAVWMLALVGLPALAQTSPGFTTGQVPTAAQWNSYFAGKVDYNAAGCAVAAGCTGKNTLTIHGVLLGEGTSPLNVTAAGTSGQCFVSGGASADPGWTTCPGGSSSPGGSSGNPQYNNAGAFAGMAGFSYNPTGRTLTGPDSSTWANGGFTVAATSKIDLDGTFLVSNSTNLIGACAGSWLIGPDPSFCSRASGGDNIGIGTIVFQDLTTGNSNVAIGSEVGRDLTTGSDDTLIGFEAGHVLTTGEANSVLGDALQSETTGSNNVAIGISALQDQNGASNNTGVGDGVGATITTGSFEICLGYGACPTVTTGNHNIMVGGEGYGIVAGHGNVALGAFAGTLADQNDSVSIGDGDGNLLLQYLVANGYVTLAEPLQVSGVITALTGGLVSGAPTGGAKGTGTVNATTYYGAGTVGVTCAAGLPSASFATVGGIVTHC